MIQITQKNTLLHTGWWLAHDPENVGKEQCWFRELPEPRVEATVPSYVHMFLPDCFGVAWYQLDFDNRLQSSKEDLCFLRFDMAEHRSEIYCNGHLAGEHLGTEDPFAIDLTPWLKRRQNRISVRVSKPWIQDVDGLKFGQIPHRNETPTGLMPGWCYNAFGIPGNVHLCFLPKVFLEDVFLRTDPQTGIVEVKCTVQNRLGYPVEAKLDAQCFQKRTGDLVAAKNRTYLLTPGENAVTLKLRVDQPLLWDIRDPNLYNVSLDLTTPETRHSTVKHCGFRNFRVGEDGYFYLNGRRIFLRCSHTGNCMPESFHHIPRDKALLRKDLFMAKAAGFNMIRFISGAALPEQLDYCDELGLMVYEEPLSGWRLLDSKNAKQVLFHNMLTMVKRDRSHSCLTIFGILNETPSKQPYGKVYLYARQLLKPIRKLSPDTLVLYSSGRWDDKHVSREYADSLCGSFANPGEKHWQCLWNCDSEIPDFYEHQMSQAGVSMYKLPGDIHDYPNPPVTRQRIRELREEGVFPRRCVFISEIGIGSMFNVLWLCRKFEEAGADPNAPDVRMVYQMAQSFLADYERFGFGEEFPYPADVLYQSEVLHNRHRRLVFDMIRANPWYNGISITGLLDHSICGEGLFTLMREWKPGIADTLQNGFAPLRWCLFLYGTHNYRNRPFEIEGLLANEDALRPDTDYPVSVKIVSKADRRTVYSRDLTLRFSPEELTGLSVPVFHETLTLDVPAGEYELRAELLRGGAATDGRLSFHISDPADFPVRASRIVTASVQNNVLDWLRAKGIQCVDLADADTAVPSVILVGIIPEEARAETWEKLLQMAENGSRILALCRESFQKDEDRCGWLPISGPKPENLPLSNKTTDWLYHMEYLAKRDCPYFEGLPSGMMDFYFYDQVINSAHFAYGPQVALPQQVHAAGFGTGMPNATGLTGGVTMGTYNLGAGALTFSCFNILDNIDENPAADRLLLNMLSAEADSLELR